MRVFLFALALFAVAAMPAHAKQERIMVYEVNSYLADLNMALNHPDPHVGKQFLKDTVSKKAVFENNILRHKPGPYSHWDVKYGHRINPYYHRYPYGYYRPYSVSNYVVLDKEEFIDNFQDKKRLVVGYSPEFVITGIKMEPYAKSAIIDVELREQSVAYAPYNPGLSHNVLQSTSRCKMYLGKYEDSLYLTRMDCNTNTHLPL